MKFSTHYPGAGWFRHAQSPRLPRSDKAVVSHSPASPSLIKHPLAAMGLALAGSILAGTAWTAFMLWWAQL